MLLLPVLLLGEEAPILLNMIESLAINISNSYDNYMQVCLEIQYYVVWQCRASVGVCVLTYVPHSSCTSLENARRSPYKLMRMYVATMKCVQWIEHGSVQEQGCAWSQSPLLRALERTFLLKCCLYNMPCRLCLTVQKPCRNITSSIFVVMSVCLYMLPQCVFICVCRCTEQQTNRCLLAMQTSHNLSEVDRCERS